MVRQAHHPEPSRRIVYSCEFVIEISALFVVISQQTQKLIQQYQNWYQSLQPKEGAVTIHVDEVASKVAAFYEKIRGVIDWREEHLLRRAAIDRVLKRRLFLRIEEKIEAQSLILELIRAGHFPNDKIEESRIEEVQKTLNKYIFIIKNSPSPKKEKTRTHLQNWLSSIAACEIEEVLDPPRKERALIEYMAELMKERIRVTNNLPEEEKNTQIFIAVHGALFKLDNPIISYHLLKRRYPQWKDLLTTELEEITKNIYSVWESIEKEIYHPLAEKFYRVCEKHDTSYLILGDVLSSDPLGSEEKLKNPEVLENSIRTAYKTRLSKLKSRLFRAAIYSTISIFLTKILVALAVEVPFDKYITQQFSYETLGINVLIPSFLMLFLVLSCRPPKKDNLEKVIMETMKIVYESEKKDIYKINLSRKRGLIMKGVIFLFYLATLFVSLWLIWRGLGLLYFSLLSKIIFIIFLSLIFFAGTKIRERAKELSIEDEKGGIMGFILDWFSLPFIQLGKWLSYQWIRYSAIIVLITVLIDLPFQIFVEFLEQWRYFVKEKKEEIH